MSKMHAEYYVAGNLAAVGRVGDDELRVVLRSDGKWVGARIRREAGTVEHLKFRNRKQAMKFVAVFKGTDSGCWAEDIG